jgi:hypothetical protein
MEPPLGGIRQASFLGDRNEVAQVTEFHLGDPYLEGMA